MAGNLEPRSPSASAVVLVRQMEIPDANLAGNVHGGTIMKMVDTAAGLAAVKHSGGLAVTAALDEMTFLEPVFVGNVVTVKAMVNEAFTTSMEVGVRVEAEDYRAGRTTHTSSAYLVFVALDEDGKPRAVPPVEAETEEQRQRQHEAKLRREARLSRREAIDQARAAAGDD